MSSDASQGTRYVTSVRLTSAAQRESAQRFIREHYPNTPVFGHGEVNPGHREPSEGMTIANAIRNERGQAMATPPLARPHPLLDANGGQPPGSPMHGSPL
jgi:hypothetical protein